MRQECKYEKELKNCSGLASIRKLQEKLPDISQEIQQSVQPVKDLLGHLFSRLKLKDESFSSLPGASDDEIRSQWRNVLLIDDSLMPSDTTESLVKHKKKYKEFIASHCCERKYMFSVRKCGKPGCCKPPRLPYAVFGSLHHLPDPIPGEEDHFQPFEDLYGKDNNVTPDKFCPSVKKGGSQNKLKRATDGTHGMPFSPTAHMAKNVDIVIICDECQRPRCLYSKHK